MDLLPPISSIKSWVRVDNKSDSGADTSLSSSTTSSVDDAQEDVLRKSDNGQATVTMGKLSPIHSEIDIHHREDFSNLLQEGKGSPHSDTSSEASALTNASAINFRRESSSSDELQNLSPCPWRICKLPWWSDLWISMTQRISENPSPVAGLCGFLFGLAVAYALFQKRHKELTKNILQKEEELQRLSTIFKKFISHSVSFRVRGFA